MFRNYRGILINEKRFQEEECLRETKEESMKCYLHSRGQIGLVTPRGLEYGGERALAGLPQAKVVDPLHKAADCFRSNVNLTTFET